MTSRLASWIERVRRFFADDPRGAEHAPMHRVLGRDAVRAYGVLTRDQPEGDPERGAVGRAWDRTRRLFLGLAGKLSASRRLLFVASIALALLGLTRNDVVVGDHEVRIVAAPLLLVLSVAGLVLLLVLELADRVVVRDELELARQLQADLMPVEAPRVDGYAFAFSYRTANTIGGDYYEFVPLADGRLLLAAGDASGHGIAAGLLMAVASASLKLAADRDPDPLAVLDIVNGALYRTGGPRAFMTLFCALLDPPSGRLDAVCAGHPFPLLRRPDGSICELGSGCLPAGIRPRLEPTPIATTFEPGATLVVYSDGIPETFDAAERAYGFDRLRRQVEPGGDAADIHRRILRDLEGFAAGEPLRDDRSLVVVTRSVGG